MSKAHVLWGILAGSALLLVLLYLLFILLPAPVPSIVWRYFSPEEVERARRYQQVLGLVDIGAWVTKIGLLGCLWWSTAAQLVSRRLERWTGNRYYLTILLFFLLLWFLLKIINLPFAFYSGFLLQHRWGFSTQSLYSWWVDYGKNSGLDLMLSGAGTLIFFWSTARWPNLWWAVVGLLMAVWLALETWIWPVVLAPLFNRFEPLSEGPVKAMVVRLSRQAGLHIDEVWVMDASRRTTKANAYFTGWGRTKRIVLYDNLLKDYSLEEVEAVLAHEMAHWQQGHVWRSLILGMVAGLAFFGLLYGVLRITAPKELFPGRPYSPHLLIIVLLFGQLASFLSLPVQNAISRRWEAEADRIALELTGNVPAMVQLQVHLARSNLQDVAPAPFIEWLTYSHPAPWRRMEAALHQ
ncbi:MAG: M48 family metallopeptidase [Moorellaceae bacterium]